MFKAASFVISSILFIAVGLAMAPSRYIACMMPMAMAQSIPSPPDGNPNHEEPAPGAHCVHDATDASHNCKCHRVCEQNKDDNGNPTQGQRVIEDPKCRSFCYAKSCNCPTDGCELS